MATRHRQQLDPAFVLHHRPYRDTSRILDVFTASAGRLTLFARGARGPKSKTASVLMPFKPLLLAWSGRGDAAQLTAAEAAQDARDLPAACLLSGFYLNELLLKLTTRHDAQPQLFADYAHAIEALRAGESIERTLRVFEKRLLAALGYGLEFDVEPSEHYVFGRDGGILAATANTPAAVSGDSLRALAREALVTSVHLEDAKRVLRAALDRCLEGRDLTTRAVARAVASKRARAVESDAT
jgi:DNA repair protein RecO (recombination protein O)